MPTIPPGTEVAIHSDALRRLSFPPPEGAVLLVAIHPAGLNAPQSPHTQLTGFDYGDLCWAGALAEDSLEVRAEGGGDPRQLMGEAMGVGARLWDVIWPGELATHPGARSSSTVYQGQRPWVVLGEVGMGDLLAAPLNEAGNPRWYTPVVSREEVLMQGSSKDAQLELAHVWTFPSSQGAVGTLALPARERVLEALKSYF